VIAQTRHSPDVSNVFVAVSSISGERVAGDVKGAVEGAASSIFLVPICASRYSTLVVQTDPFVDNCSWT